MSNAARHLLLDHLVGAREQLVPRHVEAKHHRRSETLMTSSNWSPAATGRSSPASCSPSLRFAGADGRGSARRPIRSCRRPHQSRAGKLSRRACCRAAIACRKGPSGLSTTVWVEAARAYAGRVGIPLAIVEHATPPEAIACLKAGACDQLFLPLDARAAAIAEFSNPIFQFDYTLMVPAASSIAKIADADRPGVRIAAVRNHASTNELVRQVKQAELVYADNAGEHARPAYATAKPMSWPRPVLCCSIFRPSSPEHVCWTIATAQTSIEWSSRKARRDG